MYIIITCQYEKDLTKNSWEEVLSPFSLYKLVGFFRRSRSALYQNTGVDQLCSYRTADLRLCFHNYIVYSMQNTTFLMTQLV